MSRRDIMFIAGTNDTIHCPMGTKYIRDDPRYFTIISSIDI